jgi:hypothetical protein
MNHKEEFNHSAAPYYIVACKTSFPHTHTEFFFLPVEQWLQNLGILEIDLTKDSKALLSNVSV